MLPPIMMLFETVTGNLSVAHAHDLTEPLEKGLRRRILYLGNVMIHI
jgi:hypothetical protein